MQAHILSHEKIIIYFIIGVLLFLVPFTLKSKKQTSIPEQTESTSCPLFIKVNNTTVPIEDYLIGVIAGEMPASFHMEALKAQAIASRTYVLKQTNYGKSRFSQRQHTKFTTIRNCEKKNGKPLLRKMKKNYRSRQSNRQPNSYL